MDAQEMHDYAMSKVSMAQQSMRRKSRKRLERALETKRLSDDPIAAVLKNNPGLTRERVAEIAEKLGF